jgi:hypothetical protein
MKVRRIIAGLLVAFAVPFLTGCWYAAAAGAGAVGGYEMKKKGYELQSPVTKEKQDTKKDSKKSNEQ